MSTFNYRVRFHKDATNRHVVKSNTSFKAIKRVKKLEGVEASHPKNGLNKSDMIHLRIHNPKNKIYPVRSYYYYY